MFGIYTSPAATLERLKEKPVWLLPLVLALVANLAATAVTTQYIDWQEQRDKALEVMQERGMTQEQIEKSQEGMDKFYSSAVARNAAPLVSVLVNQLLAVFLLALVVFLIAHLAGTGAGYVRALSVVAHAHLVTLPAAALRILLAVLTKSSTATTSLWAAFPNAKGGIVTALARLDPFTIWGYVLVGIGLRAVFGVKGVKAYWLSLGIWALFTLILTLLGFVGGRH